MKAAFCYSLCPNEFAERKYSESVTPSTEAKLKKAIHFINENFSSDISREGLAAFIDLHPDSLSRFFKQYTDKKIREYINLLRIREAGKLLCETDISVMEIASQVGFESLTTFNRAFMKEMKVTPSAYRLHNTH